MTYFVELVLARFSVSPANYRDIGIEATWFTRPLGGSGSQAQGGRHAVSSIV